MSSSFFLFVVVVVVAVVDSFLVDVVVAIAIFSLRFAVAWSLQFSMLFVKCYSFRLINIECETRHTRTN